MLHRISLLGSILIFAAALPAMAQVEANFWNGGGIRIGDSTTTCNAAIEGSLRYNNTTNLHQFCNGTGWGNIAGAPDSLDFTEFVDAMALDASTSITADNAEVFSIINTGTGNSFLVQDVASDTTPFVVNAAGLVGIGKTTPVASLDVVAGSTTAIQITQTTTGGSDTNGANPLLKLSGTDDAGGSGTLLVWQAQGCIRMATSQATPSNNALIICDSSLQSNAPFIANTNRSNTNTSLTLEQSGADGASDIIFRTQGSTRMTLDQDGDLGIGTTNPLSALHVPDGKYIQAEDNNAGAPPSGDCDADAERGRFSIDTSNNRLYVCNGASRGWDYMALTD